MIGKKTKTSRNYGNGRLRNEFEKSTIDDQHEMRGIEEMYNKTGRKSTNRGGERTEKYSDQLDTLSEQLKIYHRKLRTREGQYQILRQVIGETTVRRILKNLVLPNPLPEAVSRSGSLSERLIDIEHRMQQIETDHSIGVERLNTMKDEEENLSKDVDTLEYDFISLQREFLTSQQERQNYINLFNSVQNDTIKNERDIKSELRRVVEIQFGEKQTLLRKITKLKRMNRDLQENVCSLQEEPEGDDESILGLIEQNKAFRMQIATLEMTSAELRSLLSEEYQRNEKYLKFDEIINEKNELLALVDKLQNRIKSYEKLKRRINQDERVTDLQNRIEQLVSEKITIEAKYKKIKEHLESSNVNSPDEVHDYLKHKDVFTEIMRMRQSIEKLQEKNKYLENERSDLEKEIIVLKYNLKSAEEDNRTLSQEIDKQRDNDSNYQTSDNILRYDKKESELNKGELMNLRKKLTDVERKLDTEQKLRIFTEENLNDLKKTSENDKDLIETLKNDISLNGEKLNNFEEEEKRLKEALKKLEDDLSNVNSLHKKETDLNTTLEGDVTRLKIESSKLSGENCKLEEENGLLKKIIENHENLKEELCLLMKKGIELENNLTDIMRSREEVDAKNRHLTAELQSDISDLHNCVYHASTEMRDFISRGGTLSMNLKEDGGEIEDLKKTNCHLEQIITEISGRVHHMVGEIDRYKNEKLELEKSHEKSMELIKELKRNNNDLLLKLKDQDLNKRHNEVHIEKIESELTFIKRDNTIVHKQLDSIQELSSMKEEELLYLRESYGTMKNLLENCKCRTKKEYIDINNKLQTSLRQQDNYNDGKKDNSVQRMNALGNSDLKPKLNELSGDEREEIDQLMSNKLSEEFKLIGIEGRNEVLTGKLEKFMNDYKHPYKMDYKARNQRTPYRLPEAYNMDSREVIKGDDQIPISQASKNLHLKEEIFDLKVDKDTLNPINNDVIVNSKGYLKVEKEKEERLMASTSCDDINTKK